jgi:hypothetical protein
VDITSDSTDYSIQVREVLNGTMLFNYQELSGAMDIGRYGSLNRHKKMVQNGGCRS